MEDNNINYVETAPIQTVLETQIQDTLACYSIKTELGNSLEIRLGAQLDSHFVTKLLLTNPQLNSSYLSQISTSCHPSLLSFPPVTLPLSAGRIPAPYTISKYKK